MALTEVNSLGIKDLEVKTADIAAANVTLAKVENVTDGQIIVGNGSNRPTAVAVSGDVTLANTGAVPIASGAVAHAMLAGDAVDGDNLADNACDSEHYTDGSIDHAHLADDCVDGDNIADNSVGLAHMAGGTDGVIITYDASGNPVHVGPGNDGQVLTSTGAGSPPAFEDAGASVGGATGVDFNDTVKARWGTGNDLEIHHTSNNSTIKNATGSLYLNSDVVELNNAAASETMIQAEADGAVKLFYNGVQVCLTSADGLKMIAGKGIDFSAQTTTSASGASASGSELLSHYEEGTWTPVIDGADGGEYTMGGSNGGQYVRVGSLVFASCTLQWTGETTAYSGIAVINGLPFQNNGARSAVAFGPYTAGSLAPNYGSAGYRHQNGVLDPSQSRIYPTEQQEDGGYGHGPVVGTSGVVYGISVCYHTDAA